jgi:hypothetical protein
MKGIILLILIIALFSGGFWYGRPYAYWGGGFGLLLLIILLVFLFGGIR